MKIISGLIKQAINIATIPVDIIKDTVHVAIGDDYRRETNIEKKMEKIEDDIREMFENNN